MLSMKEKDELIVRLLEEGKTNKEILKLTKLLFTILVTDFGWFLAYR